MAVVSLLPVLLVFTIATFPGEWLETKLSPDHEFIRSISTSDTSLSTMSERFVSDLIHARGGRLYFDLREMLVAGNVDETRRKPASVWSNRLVLPNLDLPDRIASFAPAILRMPSSSVPRLKSGFTASEPARSGIRSRGPAGSPFRVQSGRGKAERDGQAGLHPVAARRSGRCSGRRSTAR
jgi:hypothetical protein